eukprot:CAMPEP_0115716456 /NCGR_PEP_ID=MMETSP0272-20121206/76332_1 /TAXON_ID=71861 /ORGANISM="Scrippsiella trochoidea, Strain CCMP3099" /LENGTH=135 /DNA_ID=CAMNT_0003158769 /DNA_START=30 /DNA_END=437 /DNA_ORIENTATION=-
MARPMTTAGFNLPPDTAPKEQPPATTQEAMAVAEWEGKAPCWDTTGLVVATIRTTYASTNVKNISPNPAPKASTILSGCKMTLLPASSPVNRKEAQLSPAKIPAITCVSTCAKPSLGQHFPRLLVTMANVTAGLK